MKRILSTLPLLFLACAAHAAPPTQIYIKNGTTHAADVCINGVPQGRIAGWKTAVFLGEGYVQTSKIDQGDSHGGWSRSDPARVFVSWDMDINNEGKALKYAWAEIDVTADEGANGYTEVWLATNEPVNDVDKNFVQKPIRYDSRICKPGDLPKADAKGAAIKVGTYKAWQLEGGDFKNSVGMEFVKIPAGSFVMGCADGGGCEDSEYPAHEVTIGKAFWIGKTEVTQAQWRAVMGSNPSTYTGDNRPVEQVSWDDAVSYARALGEKEGCPHCYRLPTEAEWEYMARRDGATTRNAVYGQSYETGSTAPVCSQPPGKLKLCDVLGNVWEWTADWYGTDYYRQSPASNPQGPASGQYRVIRGGSWGNTAQYVRPGHRSFDTPVSRYYHLGFRLLRTGP